jgi:hypothetical protein
MSINPAALLGAMGGAGGGAAASGDSNKTDCKEEIAAKINEVTAKFNADLGSMNDSGIMNECANKIISAVCETIQEKYSKEITTGITDNLKQYFEKLANDKKTLEKLLSELSKESKSTQIAEDNEVCDIITPEVKPVNSPNYSDLKEINRDEILRFTTNNICNYIKANPDLIGNLVNALKIKFNKHMKKVNKDHQIIWELLLPVAKSIVTKPACASLPEAGAAGGGPTVKRGGSKTKTKLYKKLLKRERTLKRQIFSV